MRDITSEDDVQIIAETQTGGILGSLSEWGKRTLSFDSEKLSTACCVGLMIDFNISDK